MTELQINGTRIVFRSLMVLSLAGSVASGIWWASGFTQEVRTMQEEIAKNKEYSFNMGQSVFSLRERAATDDADDRATAKATEYRLNSIDNTLRRIEAKIDRGNRSNKGSRQ